MSFSTTPPSTLRLKPLAWSILLALSSAAALAEGEAPVAPASTPNMGPIEIELPAGYEEELSKSGTSQKGLQVLEAQEVKAEYEERDDKGRSDVYRKDVSNVYAGKEELERYKGTSVSDVFSGLNGVYSGDARNSGALDPNIRGIQGEGRIPVTVDGTEQAMSVWQGSGGISNRNYVDPNMIGSISVEKGPSLSEGVQTGIGGSVQIKTLDVDDIVKPGQPWGIEIKTETASNSVSPDDSGARLFGRDYHDVPGANVSYEGIVGFTLPNGGRVTPRKGAGGTDFNFDDNAFRIAAGTRQEDFDLLAAYSYRRKGNYYSGKGGSQRYETEDWLDKAKAEAQHTVPGAGTSYVAQLYHPGYEVTNTSTDIRTSLVKGTWYLADQQSLKLSYMHTDMEYGESSPFVNSLTTFQGLDGVLNTGIQYPYSQVKQDTWSLSYTWNPEDNDLINLKAGIWQTHNDSKRYQTGDSIYGVAATAGDRDSAWDNWTHCQYSGNPVFCALAPSTQPVPMDNSDGRFTIIARSLQVSRHDRWGVNLSNRMAFSDTFNVTLASDFSHEKLDENYAAPEMLGSEIVYGTSHFGPRSGKRQQYNFSFNNEWTALPWLVVNAGARYSDYNSFDEGLARHRENQDTSWDASEVKTGRVFGYRRLMTDEEVATLEQDLRAEYESWGFTPEEIEQELPGTLGNFQVNGLYYTARGQEKFTSSYDGFKIDRSTNQFLNGSIDLNETVTNPQGTTGTAKRYIQPESLSDVSTPVAEQDKWAKPEKRRDHAWAPMAGLTFLLTDNARVYVRYSEMVRFPTLYEDLQAGTAFGRSSTASMNPEHAYNWEVGYVHDLRSFVPEWRHADFRINYYKNEIHDFIDRDRMYNIVQFDKKTYSGIELQARTDTGRYFSNFGISYRLEQKLCDKDYAATLDPFYNNAISSCVTGGFPQTMARTSLQPQYSINLDGGVRLFSEKLELGGRMVYHSSARNEEEAKWIANDVVGAEGFGRPYQWHPIWVFDAFASYQVTENLDVDFGVNNLTNRYYIDPLARAMMPAPGRTMKLGITARF
ncbi:MAG: TonB-dependent receptor [Paucimonas sp.]|jgi:hemoglobin/transferrin/lactoferrin receptor protein|nr:TonB-dependent receptor [Paucimonas sp.]